MSNRFLVPNRRFSQGGGKVIVSGNVNMMAVPKEVPAMQRSGMIMFFFESQRNHWDFLKKSSALLSTQSRNV
jgi:hypothetical protein